MEHTRGCNEMVEEDRMTNERNCETCAHAQPFGGENDNRCDAWECEYINRKEAIKAYKAGRDNVNNTERD